MTGLTKTVYLTLSFGLVTSTLTTPSIALGQLCETNRIFTVTDTREMALCRLDPAMAGCDDLDVDGDGDVDTCDIQIAMCAIRVPINSTTCCDDTACFACDYTARDGTPACEEMTAGQCDEIAGEPSMSESCPPSTSDAGMMMPDAAPPLDSGPRPDTGAAPDTGLADDSSLPPIGADGSIADSATADAPTSFRGAGGCACRITGQDGRTPPPPYALCFAAGLLVWVNARRR